MRTLIQDLRYALRTLWKAPVFAAVAVATITLGIGANTVIFSVVHAVLLRRLPYPAAYRLTQTTVSGTREPELLRTGEVSAPFFPLLGARPTLGRGFTDADDRPGAAPTVVLSDELWRTRFGGDRSVIGTRLRLNAQPHTIVGVLPRGFAFFPQHGDLYRPMGLHGADRGWLSRGNHEGASVLARLSPLLVAAVVLAACVFPARNALRVDPNTVLRDRGKR